MIFLALLSLALSGEEALVVGAGAPKIVCQSGEGEERRDDLARGRGRTRADAEIDVTS